jgi:uncharacterized membrane protein YeiB
VVLVWIINLTISPWWLRRFQHGPAEAILRYATYGQTLMKVRAFKRAGRS